MVWSLALRSDDAKQDPVVYGTKFSVVFLAEGPHVSSSYHTVREEWWSAAAAGQVRPPLAARGR